MRQEECMSKYTKPYNALSEKKVQKLSLGRYTFVPFCTFMYQYAPFKVYLLKRYRPSDSFCTFAKYGQTQPLGLIY